MRGFRSDLPLRGDSASRFVAWLVMVLVFMAAFAVTVSVYVGALLGDWNRGVSGTLTVQIPAVQIPGGDPAGADAAVAKVVDVLGRHPAVAHVRALSHAEIAALLKPWLGDGAVADLPLPALIDVEMRASDPAAVNAVTTSVKAAAPAAVIDDHRVWLNRVSSLAEGIGAIAVAIMALVTAALGLTIIFATRASLTEFAQVIEILHVVGAKDGYVANQFARRVLSQAFVGGLCGLVLYAPALALVGWLAARVDPEILPAVKLPLVHWLILGLLPVIAGLLAMVTANVTVRRTLGTRI